MIIFLIKITDIEPRISCEVIQKYNKGLIFTVRL